MGTAIGAAAASLSAGAAVTYGLVKLVDWLTKPKTLPAPPRPTYNDQDDGDDVDDQDGDDVDDQDGDDVDDQDGDDDGDDDDQDDEPEPTRAAPRQAKPEPTRAAPRQVKPEPARAPPRRAQPDPPRASSKPPASRRGPVFIPRAVVEPPPVVEPWMKAWAEKLDAGIKAQERNRR